MSNSINCDSVFFPLNRCGVASYSENVVTHEVILPLFSFVCVTSVDFILPNLVFYLVSAGRWS